MILLYPNWLFFEHEFLSKNCCGRWLCNRIKKTLRHLMYFSLGFCNRQKIEFFPYKKNEFPPHTKKWILKRTLTSKLKIWTGYPQVAILYDDHFTGKTMASSRSSLDDMKLLFGQAWKKLFFGGGEKMLWLCLYGVFSRNSNFAIERPTTFSMTTSPFPSNCPYDDGIAKHYSCFCNNFMRNCWSCCKNNFSMLAKTGVVNFECFRVK